MQVGVCRARPLEEGDDALDLHLRGDLFTLLTGANAADVDDVGTERDRRVEGREGTVEGGVPIASIERV
jgi:hypothetical protein